MPPKGTKKSTHHHDKRHENGLAAPVKRPQRSRSNGNLNGNAFAPAPPHVAQSQAQPSGTLLARRPSSPPSPSAGVAPSANGTAAALEMAVGSRTGKEHHEPSVLSAASTSPDIHQYRNGAVEPPPPPRRRPEPNRTMYKTATGLGDVMRLATTIVASCPLCDVLAILIILLQLPPTFLTIIDALFACLTFVPPASGASLSALPSLSDMFQGSGGRTSLWTVVFLDVVALFGWLFLWVPAQNIALDLAQVVIAISLGGAVAGRGGTMNAIVFCLGIILPYHAFRYRPTRRFGLKLLVLGLSKAGLEVPSSDSPLFAEPDRADIAPNLVQDMLGVHILTQGVTRLILRALSHRESSQTLVPGKRIDPEAGAASRMARVSGTAGDSGSDPPSYASTDGRPPGPSPSHRDSKDKAAQARRKKRRSAHVRSQQPLWAAVASTKVTFHKQKEQNQASFDAAEAHAVDSHHLGSADFRLEGDRVWIYEVGPTEVSFGVNCTDMSTCEVGKENASHGLGIDRTKPFYVRVNGATWSSTRIRRSTDEEDDDEGSGVVWEGVIFGLTALSNYNCEFVCTVDDQLIHSFSLITSPAPSNEPTAVVSPTSRQSLRPPSPTTTLKNSIAAAEQNLHDHRARLKRNRKDHKGSITSSKREVENLTNRLSTSGGSDEKQRQRALQFNQNVRQAEEAATELSERIRALEKIPEDEQTEHDTLRKQWQQENERKVAAVAEFERSKADTERQLSNLRSEISSTVQKRDRLQTRQAKLNEQHDRLVSANAQGVDAKARKENERVQQAQARVNIEQQFHNQIRGIERQIHELNTKTSQTYQQLQQLDLAYKQTQQSMPTASDGVVAGPTLPSSGIGRGAMGFPSFPFGGQNPQSGNKSSMNMREGRGRSSSMLSDVSGFTDDLADTSHQPPRSSGVGSPSGTDSKSSSTVTPGKVRKSSKTSSGSTGSQHDPLSPETFRAASTGPTSKGSSDWTPQ